MPLYRKKPVVIEARKWDGENTKEILEWADLDPFRHSFGGGFDLATGEATEGFLVIPTLEGDHKAMLGDYIIKGIKGEFYPCKPDIFEATYEEVVE